MQLAEAAAAPHVCLFMFFQNTVIPVKCHSVSFSLVVEGVV